MSFLSKLKNTIKGLDPFYQEVKTDQVALYQNYFMEVLHSVDIDTQTAWSDGRDYDRQQMDKDEKSMEEIIFVKARADGLSPALLQVMVTQYFFADIYQRELDRDNWIKRVLKRKNEDYFPSGSQVRALLERSEG